MLTEFRIPPSAGRKAGHAVIFLHGLGDNGQGGLLSIGKLWQSALPPDTEFFCPNAPYPYSMNGMEIEGGRQWFSLEEFSLPSMERGVKKAAPALNEYIDHVLISRELPPHKLALVGFSQGTMMALFAAPRRSAPLAGVVGYSGLLVGGENLAAEKKSTLPILLVHGMEDDVVPYALLNPAEQSLKAAGFTVTSVSCPGTAHGIDDRGLAEGARFLKRILI